MNTIVAAAEAGMLNDVERLRIISHNLANVSTVGFKREFAVTRPFAELLAAGNSTVAANVATTPIIATHTDRSAGALTHTGNPLDLAIEGDAYFVIDTGTQEAYTRQGTFRLNADGELVTVAGQPVLTNAGEVRLTSPAPVIDADGTIHDGDTVVGQLKLVTITNPESLRDLGGGLLAANDSTTVAPSEITRVRQGFNEAANVATMNEMIRMIETVRHFETSQRLILGYDAMLGRAITDLGNAQ